MFTIQYNTHAEWWGYGSCDVNVTADTNKTHNPALKSWFWRGGKKEEYTKPCTEGREVSNGNIWLTTVAVTQDLLSGMPLVLKIEFIRLLDSISPEPGQPSAQLSKLIRLTACTKAMQTISRWYRTVYIPWLVASFDTHKGKLWLNCDPPNHMRQNVAHWLPVIDRLVCSRRRSEGFHSERSVPLHSNNSNGLK